MSTGPLKTLTVLIARGLSSQGAFSLRFSAIVNRERPVELDKLLGWESYYYAIWSFSVNFWTLLPLGLCRGMHMLYLNRLLS